MLLESSQDEFGWPWVLRAREWYTYYYMCRRGTYLEHFCPWHTTSAFNLAKFNNFLCIETTYTSVVGVRL